MNIAHTIFETVQKLPKDKAEQVLVLAEALQQQEQQEKTERHKRAIEKIKSNWPFIYCYTLYTK
ncbi:hypothetical protein [Acinetobacter puyangensis]|uniref:hypothetical protein n=1 Tax=Acinetobacter puyangensis TaxID=1096779 RepID=UPI003A4E10DE